jgi:hypothetical protein
MILYIACLLKVHVISEKHQSQYLNTGAATQPNEQARLELIRKFFPLQLLKVQSSVFNSISPYALLQISRLETDFRGSGVRLRGRCYAPVERGA